MIVRMSARSPAIMSLHELAEAALEQVGVLVLAVDVLDGPAPMAAIMSAVPRFGSRMPEHEQGDEQAGDAPRS